MGAVGGIAGKLLTDAKKLPETAPERIDAELMIEEMQANPQRLDYEGFKKEALRIIRMAPEDLARAADGTGRTGEMARHLIAERAKVQRAVDRGELKPNEVAPVLREQPVSQAELAARDAAIDRQVMPEYRAKLEARLVAAEELIPALEKQLRNVRGRDVEAKTAIKNRIEGKKDEIEGIKKQIAEADKAEAALKQGDTRTVEYEWATKAAQKAEEDRIAALKAADERYLQRRYQDDLIRTDMAWLRREQKLAEERVIGKKSDLPTESPRELAPDVPEPPVQARVEAVRAVTHPAARGLGEELDETTAGLEALKRAEGCLE